VRIASPHHHLDTFLEWTARWRVTINLVHVAFDFKCDNAFEAQRRARYHLFLTHAPNAMKLPMEEARRRKRGQADEDDDFDDDVAPRKILYDENCMPILSGDFYFKDFRRERDADGKPVGPRRGTPAKFGRVYLLANDMLRIELCFKYKADIEKKLPPLHSILDTDPTDIMRRHLRWRTYRPRVLAKKMRAQAANTTGQPATGVWPRLLMAPSPGIMRMTVGRPLDFKATWA
jgi:hypothetical protein